MKQRRLLLFLPHVSDGGAERVVLSLGASLVREGMDVRLVVGGSIAKTAPDISAGIRVTEVGASSTPRSLPKLALELRKFRPHAILAALPHANVVAAAAHRLVRSGARLILSEHLTLAHEPPRETPKRILIRWATTLAYREADAIVAVSEGVACDLEKAYGISRARLRVIENPVLDEEFFSRREEALPSSFSWEREHGRRGVRVIAVGRLTAQKDVATALRAFAILLRQQPAELVVLGDGEDKPELQRLTRALGIDNHVRFLGVVRNPLPFMRSADLLVHTARYEGFGNVLVEALACGTPVVATDCPHGPRQIVQELGRGTLVPIGDFEAVAAAMNTTLEHSRLVELPPARFERYTAAHSAMRYESVLFRES